MDLRVLETQAALELLCNTATGAQIERGYTSDLLSDVLANAEEDSVLITLQAHKNSVAVASIAGVNAIIFCTSQEIAPEIIEAAEDAEIAIFRTDLNQFQCSILVGKLLEEHS